MSDSLHIASKMEIIRNGFQHGKESASTIRNIKALIEILRKDDSEFRSVVFEGASMELALRGFADGTMKEWIAFRELSDEHAAQVFIGLGWAIAQEKRTDLVFTSDLDPQLMFRAWDGSGYFDAIFRQRQTVKNNKRMDYVPADCFPEYDQGMGRSLWYIVKGDTAKLSEMLELFDPPRHSDLWRGVGIACSYVGGFSVETLETLSTLAGIHKTQLAIGAAMVAKSRILANCVTPEIEIACNKWCGLNAVEAMALILKAENVEEYLFKNMIVDLEKKLRK